MSSTAANNRADAFMAALPESATIKDAVLGFRVVESVVAGRIDGDLPSINDALGAQDRIFQGDVQGNEGVMFAILAAATKSGGLNG